ncbi:putative nucleic acid-binding Zn ribbon protein [Sporomusaceae bacterium BoRhaA]|uniref:hypothetical protein n=1 Tax=Pelorhabdus rhamnosifermentans TaxID=2772457 RepID=UPI001C0634E1|nr:hypothetical protein [Pelorhabdus rhamnosifermentans]MBU2700914.1 putative nucleic acid-binding Zn ribbon protein [Pelorhabdus rhamnosifermentans]
MDTCPVCGRRGIGKVGTDQYYCWDCCVEFIEKNGQVEVFTIEDDGTLVECAQVPG